MKKARLSKTKKDWYECYAQVEGIDFNETFASVARRKTIRMFLSLVTYKNFKVFQMDVKAVFLNSILEEEVYIEQLDGFQFGYDPNMVCKLKNALYGLKQAPRAWYARLNKYLLEQGFKQEIVGSNLYVKNENGHLIIVYVYVDDIILAAARMTFIMIL